jgi:hydrogenase nickel incorporation protein HypA/HybF
MHELSLVTSIVESVTETLSAYPKARLKAVRLRVGVLASVIPETLEFCYGIATEGTPLEGSRLVVDLLPVVVHCEHCNQDVTLEGMQSFRCPQCGELCGDLRQGRELEIDSIEVDDVDEEKS